MESLDNPITVMLLQTHHIPTNFNRPLDELAREWLKNTLCFEVTLFNVILELFNESIMV